MSDNIRNFVSSLLADRGRPSIVSDTDALFTSGLLDSLAATELMVHLETEYSVDLADADFDISQLNTVNDLQNLVGG